MIMIFLLVMLVPFSAPGQPVVGGGGAFISDLTQIDGAMCTDSQLLQNNNASEWVCADPPSQTTSGAILDLGDDGNNESTGIEEIATTGDTNSIFSEPSANKLLIDVGQNWPVADTATTATTANSATTATSASALASDPANCSAGTAPLGVNEQGVVQSCTDFEEDLSDSSGLAAAISDETGSGAVVFGTSPTIATPSLTLQDGNGAAPTTSGQIKYDRTTERLEVGDGSGTSEFVKVGTLTDTNLCVWDAAGQEIDCNTTGSGGGATSEAELESNLADVSDVFTNNDGALDDDDLSDDNISALQNVNASANAADNEILVGDGTDYQGINLPVCNTTTEKLAFSGTALSCETDATGGSVDLDQAFDNGDGEIDNAVCGTKSFRVSAGGTTYWDFCVNTTDNVPVAIGTCSGGSCDNRQNVPTDKGFFVSDLEDDSDIIVSDPDANGTGDGTITIRDDTTFSRAVTVTEEITVPQVTIDTNTSLTFQDEEGASSIFVIDPDAASVNAMYQFSSGYEPLVSAEVPLRPAGDCTVSEEAVVTNAPLAEWITCEDTTGDSVAFDYKLTGKTGLDVTLGITMTAVNLNASPSGTFTLNCAAQSIRPGTDAYAAHSTTGQQGVSFTTFDTQNRAETATATVTINGTVASGAHIMGQCNVSAAPGQIADIRLSGSAVIELSANSLSD